MPLAVVVAVRTDSLGGNGWRNEEVVRYTTTAADGSFTLRGPKTSSIVSSPPRVSSSPFRSAIYI